MTKKDIIVETAINLFNEKGYSNVSLREIAAAAGTTIGNMTYHFPQKVDLLIGIVENLHTEFLTNAPSDMHRAELLSHLLNSFLIAEKNQKENPFYYENMLLLTLDSREIEQRNKQFQKKIFDYYTQILSALKEEGVIKADIKEESLQSLTYAIITMITAWRQRISPYKNEELPAFQLSLVLKNLLYPLLADTYKKEFEMQCREKNI